MTTIMMAAVAILMILCPEQYIDALVSVLGYGMVILAIVWILQFISGKKSLIRYIYLTGALIVALLGVTVLAFENIVLAIGIVFGLVLVGDGVITIVNAWTYVRRARSKGWLALILLSVLLVAFGLIVLVNPWWSEPTKLFDVIGYALLFSSVISIVRLIMIWPIKSE